MCDIIPENIERVVAKLRPKIREAYDSRFTTDLGIEWYNEAASDDAEPEQKGLKHCANVAWKYWREWVHGAVRAGYIKLDEKGRRVGAVDSTGQRPQPPGHQEWAKKEYLGAVPLYLGPGQDEGKVEQDMRVLLEACTIDCLYRHPKRHRLEKEEWPAAINYVVDILFIGLDALTYAHGAQRALEDKGRKGTVSFKLQELFYQRLTQWWEQSHPDERRKEDRKKKKKKKEERGEADKTPDEFDFSSLSDPRNEIHFEPDCVDDGLEGIVVRDILQAAERHVQERAQTPDSRVKPEEAKFILRVVIASSGELVHDPPSDKRLAALLRRETGDRSWDEKLAMETRQLVEGWCQRYLKEESA